MATYQTTYTERPAKGLHGQIASEEKSNRISRTVESAGGIKFGTPVQRGTSDHGVVAFASGTFLGIAILNPAVPGDADNPDAYPQHFTGAFMTQGPMYVTAGGNVSDGGEVFYNTSTGRYVGAAGANIVGPIPDAVFDTSGGDGDIVEISLRLRATIHPEVTP
ncbi:hypothetical protein C7441_112177 [Pseudaminobacter salicylatoxidans]|uniref:Uncharacterized protein n=1 Tax=Pseudaminobacter salicylatoxidans TaxID=93369 RepID=A0A316BZV6_PSESE|nr:DUF2190 family protein [Pseudaminobacter salicylatoxidans]PWJ80635.1 hypothetical protein C7441_112177 [Pseudaminobacter salicylatoxidans]